MGCHGCIRQRISEYSGIDRCNYDYLDSNLSEVEEEVGGRPFVIDKGKLVTIGNSTLYDLIKEFYETRPNALITTIEIYKEILKAVNLE
jgi:predicted aconitase with swiveling domain